MAVKCAMQVGLFWECRRLPHHPLMGLCCTAIFGAITPAIFLGSSTFLSLGWLWFILLYLDILNVWKGCVGRQGRGADNVGAFWVYQKRKAGYTEPYTYLCQHLFLSLLIPGLLLCVAPPAHYLSFSLACFLFSLSLPPSPAPSLPVCSDASSWLTAHKMK